MSKNKPHTLTKICVTCKKRKKKEQFFKCDSSLDGKSSWCKKCKLAYAKIHREDNEEHYKEMARIYREEHKLDIAEYHQEYYSRPEIKEKMSEWHKEYKKKNAEELRAYYKKYNKENAERLSKNALAYYYANKDKIKKRRKELRDLKK